MENPIKMDDCGVPLFSETSISISPTPFLFKSSKFLQSMSMAGWRQGVVSPQFFLRISDHYREGHAQDAENRKPLTDWLMFN